jgi:hypothetical protein
LSGSVDIVTAIIKMPQVLNDEVVRRESKFYYVNKDLMRYTITSTIDSAKLDSINNSKNGYNKQQQSIVDLLNIDLSVKIKNFSITLGLGGMGNIFARVGTQDPNIPLRYEKERTEPEAKIYGGELEVLSGSTIQIFKTMSAKGSITFPTARISQPNLNLTAEYKGKINSEKTGTTSYSVFVYITGTAQSPVMDLNYSVNGNLVTGDKHQIQTEAMSALAFGTLRGYNDDNSGMLGESSNYANMLFSQIASEKLTDLLLKTGIVQSANIKLEDDSFNSANVSISGMLGGFAT